MEEVEQLFWKEGKLVDTLGKLVDAKPFGNSTRIKRKQLTTNSVLDTEVCKEVESINLENWEKARYRNVVNAFTAEKEDESDMYSVQFFHVNYSGHYNSNFNHNRPFF
jgi:hypothetical protein